jgi:tetratricopeptide (TPR) repeat protein
MEKIMESHQDDPYALFAFAHLSMRQARFDTALTTLDKALQVKPKWSNAVVLRARILAMQGARKEALDYLDQELKGEMAGDVEVGLTYARMLTEARKLDEALEQFSMLADADPKNAEINYYAGVLSLQLKKFDQAQHYLEAVLQQGSRVLEANFYLGQLAELKRDFETAITRYSIVRHGEFYFNAQVRIVAILSEQNRYDRALEQLHSIRTNSDKQKLQLNLLEGDILREAGRFPDAKDFYTKLLDDEPDETSIRYARALVAEKLGELDLVESDLQAILLKEPQNAQVLNALGYTLADRTNRFDEALHYIQSAMELEPNDAAVVDSIGWVQYRMGNYKNAIMHLRRANELAKDPEIAAHLGEVLWVSGDKNGAMSVWESSLKEHPEDEVLLNIMKKFGL